MEHTTTPETAIEHDGLTWELNYNYGAYSGRLSHEGVELLSFTCCRDHMARIVRNSEVELRQLLRMLAAVNRTAITNK